ncbi:glycosyltransferase family 39 protein [Pinisolibacter sp.]|uniref:glycosyltransferase family 39 protein n=1 Tax=Pinisolibacter sp. TaxID=2172024 RepID=UPI002FDD2206
MAVAAPTRRETTIGLPPIPLVGALTLLLVARLIVAGFAGLTDDEAYYRLWSLKLQAGYYDHAPMVAWVIRAGREIFGDTAFGLRVFSPLATFVGSFLLWRTVALVDGRATATRAVVLFNATILIGAGSVLMTPDTPSVFFWGATVWALAELATSRNPNWWLAVGVAAGLGLFSKYSVLFLGLGIVVWLVSTRETRRWFATWQLWAGGAIAVALFTPVVLWNAEHGWISFAKQFGRTVPHGMRPEKFLEFLGVQWLLIGLPLAPFAVWGALRTARSWRAGEGAAALPLVTSLPFLAYLVFHSFHGGIEGNWPAPLYAGFAWMAARAIPAVADLDGRTARLAATAARIAAPLGFGVTALLYVHAVVALVVLPPERDPTAQMRGWDAFAADIEALRRETGAASIAVPSYALAGQFMRRLGTDHVVPLADPERYAHLPPPDPAMLEKPALFVTRARKSELARFAGRFDEVRSLGTRERTLRGRVVDTYTVHLLSGPHGDPRR